VQQISIETAQSSLDCSVLAKLPGKQIILGVLDLSNNEVETPEVVAARIRLADSQTVIAIAEMSDGSFWSDEADVVVTLAACVEGL